MIARRAQREIEPMMAIGMPSSNGHGVAMTSTARKRIDSPLIAQARHGHRQGHRRVDGPELIAEPAQLRPRGLGLVHHRHDLRVARVRRALGRANGERRLAVDRTRDHRRATGLGDLERLAREIGLVHDPVAVDHHAIHRGRSRADRSRACRPPRSLPAAHPAMSRSRFRWAIEGIRLASAASTEEALRNA